MLKFEERFFIMMVTLRPYLFDSSFVSTSEHESPISKVFLEQSDGLFALINLLTLNKMERSLTYLTYHLYNDDE